MPEVGASPRATAARGAGSASARCAVLRPPAGCVINHPPALPEEGSADTELIDANRGTLRIARGTRSDSALITSRASAGELRRRACFVCAVLGMTSTLPNPPSFVTKEGGKQIRTHSGCSLRLSGVSYFLLEASHYTTRRTSSQGQAAYGGCFANLDRITCERSERGASIEVIRLREVRKDG